ncbi:MAG: hypothetical protein NT077_01465 [Candidatus Taylorbacteria bacterium]|nr:hypothetical protein [Candidatus Taylorbacteria bacterium]
MPPELPDNLIASSGIPVPLTEEVLPNAQPQKFYNIPDPVVDTVSVYMNVVLKMSPSTKHQEIDVKGIIDNGKSMFRDGVKYNDTFWPQHIAASMREIVGFVKVEAEDFYTAHSSIPSYATDPEIKKQLDRIVLMRSYFSDIVHFVKGNRIGIVHKLYPNDGYGVMRPDKFFKDEESTLEKICIDFIYILNDIFVKHCVGVVRPASPTGSSALSGAQAASASPSTPVEQAIAPITPSGSNTTPTP